MIRALVGGPRAETVRKRTRVTMVRLRGVIHRPDPATLRAWRDGLFRLLDVVVGTNEPRPMGIMLTRVLGACSRNYRFRCVQWLDQNQTDRVRELEPASSGHTYGPSIDGNQRNAVVRLPSVDLYRFRNGTVHGQSSSVLFADGVVIERTEGCDPRRVAFQTEYLRRHERHVALVTRKPRERLDRGIFLGGNGSFNYYHWMIEILPKLRHSEQLGEEYRDFPLLVSEDVAHIETFAQALDLLAPERPLIFLKASNTYVVEDLLYISAANGGPFNMRPGHGARVSDFHTRRSTIEFLRRQAGCVGGQSEAGLRLFLARPTVRRCYNQDEVFALLRSRGFISVALEELTWSEQIDVMSRAEAVVGASGAAWTNVIFCSPGTKCLSWIPEEVDEFASYSTLASFVGADMRYVTYKAGMSSTTEIYSANYQVNVDWIEKTLDALGICAPVPGMR
jgi:capsular polysaccharide biosynthesis protein